MKEKIGFAQNDYDYAIKQFSKMTQQKPGKADQYFSFEGFKVFFTENPVFAQKLYIFMRNYGGQNYVDLNTFLIVVDLFTRTSMKLQNQLKNLDIQILFILVSLSSSEIMQKDTFNFNNVYKISISYSNAVKLFKELINMQSDKGDILCHDDDQAPILLVNNIFKVNNFILLDHSILNYKAFIDKIKQETPQISKIVKNYIAGKFINKMLKNQLPKLESSELMNKQLIALLNLSVPWFYKCVAVNQVYKYELESGQTYNFNVLGNSLLQMKGPNVILFRHLQRDKDTDKIDKYTFGYFHLLNGKEQGFFHIFCSPKIQNILNKQLTIKQICFIDSYHNQKQTQTLQSQLKQGPKQPGLGIGGSGYDHHRIWIDGKQLQASRLAIDDKTFQSGPILPNDIHLLNIDLIEIWDLQLNTAAQSTSYFKSTTHQHYCGEEEQRFNQHQLRDVLLTLNQQSSNDYRRGTQEYQISNPLLPISEEEEEKQQGK